MVTTYNDIAIELRERIQAGFYVKEKLMPSERSLVAEFSVHRATIRKAINLLVSQGLLVRTTNGRTMPSELRIAKEGNIGIFAAEPKDSYARSLLVNGISEMLLERNSHSSLIWSHFKPFQLNAPIEERSLNLEMISGVVLWPPVLSDTDLLRKVRNSIPLVIVDNRIPGFEADFAGFKDIEAGYAITKHLYSLGHRKIAFIGDLVPETVRCRLYGFEQFCAEAGIDRYWPWASYGGSIRAIPSIIRYALEAVSHKEWPTALVCANDETAIEMITHMSANRISVPGDMAATGFGNSQQSLLSALGLTTMHQPFEQVGREAVSLLWKRQDSHPSRGETEEVRLSMELVVRRSCGS